MREIGLLTLVVLGGLLTMIGCGDNDAVITVKTDCPFCGRSE